MREENKLWWLLALGGIAYLINKDLEREVGVQRRRWEDNYQKVSSSIQYHREKIEAHLADARQLYDFYALTELHFSSTRVADEAYNLRQDCYISRNAIQRSLNLVLTNMNELYQSSKLAGITLEEKNRIHSELQDLKKLKLSLKEDIYQLNDKIESYSQELKRFNHTTHNLKIKIRDNCGFRGLNWYNDRERNSKQRRISS